MWDPEKAEINQYNLYPGIYSGETDFQYKGLGYPDQKIDNILIEKGKTTVVKIVMDLNDKTGVFGKVTNLNGNPVEDVEVYISSSKVIDGVKEYANTYTNSNGEYKIIGLSQGRYTLNFYKSFGPTFTSFDIPSEEIPIKTNVMIEVNKKIKTL